MKKNLLIYRKQEKRTYENKTNLADIIFVKKIRDRNFGPQKFTKIAIKRVRDKIT